MNLLLSLLCATLSFAQPELLEISSDKQNYVVNESAILRASLSTKPADPDFELDLVSTLNGNEQTLQRSTDFEFYAQTTLTAVGSYAWMVQVVLQEKQYAKDLKEAIAGLTQEIQNIDEELLTATDPVRIAQLQAARLRKVELRSATQTELANHRTPVGNPSQITFIVE